MHPYRQLGNLTDCHICLMTALLKVSNSLSVCHYCGCRIPIVEKPKFTIIKLKKMKYLTLILILSLFACKKEQPIVMRDDMLKLIEHCQDEAMRNVNIDTAQGYKDCMRDAGVYGEGK